MKKINVARLELCLESKSVSPEMKNIITIAVTNFISANCGDGIQSSHIQNYMLLDDLGLLIEY